MDKLFKVAPINNWQAHHIVPEGSKYQAAEDARQILRELRK